MAIILVAVLLFIFALSISRLGKVTSVTFDGLSIRTLFGRVDVEWQNVRSPVRISRLLWLRVVEIKFVNARFLSKRNAMAAWIPKEIGYERLIASMPASVQSSDWT